MRFVEEGQRFSHSIFTTLNNRLFLPPPRKRRANLSEDFVSELEEKLGLKFVDDESSDVGVRTGDSNADSQFNPEDVLYYTYAVFHSPEYRKRYAEFLKIDFPRLPLTSDIELFRKLVALGDELVKTHLLERELPDMATYPAEGDNVVIDLKYEPAKNPAGSDSGRVWINKQQYFEGVPEEVWDFHIGGYQVCHKWLKDRKGRKLNLDDLIHYKKIVSALAETIRLMTAVDDAIAEHGGFPLT